MRSIDVTRAPSPNRAELASGSPCNHAAGALTDKEFQAAKTRLLG